MGVPPVNVPVQGDGEVGGFSEPLKTKLLHEQTASRLAGLLVLILLATLLLHFGAVFYIVYVSDHADVKTDAIDKVFNIWVPIVSGLVGTAVAYYLGEKKGR
jgi:hypothetical protein